MPFFLRRRPHAAALTVAAAASILVLSACTPAATDSRPGTGSDTSAAAAVSGLPSAHVHGLSVNGETGQVLLATHEGLFDVSGSPAVKIGPTNDYMGFTATMDPDVFYASGHPGAGSDLPNPLGLIKTTDGGRTWQQLSRQKESDFHALAATKSGIVAFDGTMRTSANGSTWQTVAADFTPAVLAGHPDSDTVLATTRDGVQRSTDGGTTWELNASGPVIQFVAFAGAGEAVGVAPDGSVYHSPDAGVSWTQTGTVTGEVQAIAATSASASDGTLQVWAATSSGLVKSTDGGATFRPYGAE
ncbi:F510_1955 family glycosylhydrolase [Arthrobacter sp. PAMC25284]|uniref:F510_1955 family glycosylhydrolase n=1 Tax=Arthrobacter sp. PAMC25284 TaxID=2861279 RepID=UPI001C63888A|nr:exo-alpha-sialidase [Arthrobacter sp. PAMC25284]QYF91039.1 exo-alpha-sialidase [Arthrobacter sp. PAMC25284]